MPGALQWPLRHQIRLRVDAAEHEALVRLGHGGDKRDTIIAWMKSEQGIVRHREFTRRCFMELRASESVSNESSTGSSAALIAEGLHVSEAVQVPRHAVEST